MEGTVVTKNTVYSIDGDTVYKDGVRLLKLGDTVKMAGDSALWLVVEFTPRGPLAPIVWMDHADGSDGWVKKLADKLELVEAA